MHVFNPTWSKKYGIDTWSEEARKRSYFLLFVDIWGCNFFPFKCQTFVVNFFEHFQSSYYNLFLSAILLCVSFKLNCTFELFFKLVRQQRQKKVGGELKFEIYTFLCQQNKYS